jgi:hypothetical protein
MNFRRIRLIQGEGRLEKNAVFIFSQALKRRLWQIFVMQLELLGDEGIPGEKTLNKWKMIL